MTDIKRAAWLAFAPADVEAAPFTVADKNGPSFGQKSGARVAAVVEVQPVLEALWAAHDKSTYEGRALLIGLIRQLEKALQP